MKLSRDEFKELLEAGGLESAEAYRTSGKYRKTDWILTKCLRCGAIAHYRIAYIQEKTRLKALADEAYAEYPSPETRRNKKLADQLVCRACYWRAWYRISDGLYRRQVEGLLAEGRSPEELKRQGVVMEPRGLAREEADQLASSHGYELLDLLYGDNPGDDILLVRCEACGRRSALRPGDVACGCSCVRAKRSRNERGKCEKQGKRNKRTNGEDDGKDDDPMYS